MDDIAALRTRDARLVRRFWRDPLGGLSAEESRVLGALAGALRDGPGEREPVAALAERIRARLRAPRDAPGPGPS